MLLTGAEVQELKEQSIGCADSVEILQRLPSAEAERWAVPFLTNMMQAVCQLRRSLIQPMKLGDHINSQMAELTQMDPVCLAHQQTGKLRQLGFVVMQG